MNSKRILLYITLTIPLYSYNIALNRSSRVTTQKTDIKSKFVPRRMTDQEKEYLSTHIQAQLATAKKNQDHLKIESYELLTALLEKLDTESLHLNDPKNEKAYTDYFKLVVAELESLGENPQAILQTTGLRQKLLEGKLERMPWFVKEIEGVEWFFEIDAKQAAFNAERLQNGLTPFGPTKAQWPTPKDKALYIISLAEQIERNHNRIENKDDLASVIQTVNEYLIDFLPAVPSVFKRAINEALNRLEKIRNIRGIPSLKI